MNDLLRWLHSTVSRRGKALWHYRHGMEHANARRFAEAIHSYSVVVDLRGGPPDVQAMARYNRALVYASTGDEASAIDDLDTVLAMKQPLTDIKTAARQRLQRMQRQTDRSRI